jgi:glycosyltransferase involved in cell wall biosynthesis
MTVHLDISQLMRDPRRSGIQRAERELIRHWPGPAPLKPCWFDPATDAMHALSDEVLHALCEDAGPGGVAGEQARLAAYVRPGPPITPERLLNAELFLDPQRAEHYRSAKDPSGIFWLVYDFLPWLEPGWFATGSAARFMPYLRALRQLPNVAFISARTRDDYIRRIAHRPSDGPVIPMGGDGLLLEAQSFDASRRQFVMLGSIEPRKNAAAAMRAFRALWRDGVDAHFVMIGEAAEDAVVERGLLRQLSREGRFQHLHGLPDAGVRHMLRQARAMVFPSEGEGFGIPPIEALHAGIPVIVAAGLPALAGQPGLGQVRLDPVTTETIAEAVRAVLDDSVATRLWDEAARMPVPTWVDFAHRVARWVQE